MWKKTGYFLSMLKWNKHKLNESPWVRKRFNSRWTTRIRLKNKPQFILINTGTIWNGYFH